MKKLIVASVFLFACISSFAQPSVGQSAKEISLPGVKGDKINLASLKGKIVLVDFWASWCGPCRRAVPDLKNVYSKYQSKGFEIYGISLDDDKNNWKRAIKEDSTTWMHVIDATGNIAFIWKVMYIPNTFLLDKTGKIIAVNPSHEELEELLQKLLG